MPAVCEAGNIAIDEDYEQCRDGPFIGSSDPHGMYSGNEVASVASEVVRYRIDDETVAQFEIEPVDGFRPAGVGDIAGRVWESAGPAVEAAKAVLERVKEVAPDSVQVKFGVKVTGTANWLVAKAATEGNFEITLSWAPGTAPGGVVNSS